MATESKPSASSAAAGNTGNAKGGDQDTVTLLSQENTRFVVPREQAELSGLVKTMTEDEGNEEEVPLMDVRADVLRKVLEFCRHHTTEGYPIKEIEKPLPSSNLASIVSEWDANFVDVDQETLFDLILAANYLDIKPLLDLTCAKVATMIKDKTPEEIRQTFNIANDFTPEEERQVKEENHWADDA